ncbi:hypothetical protein TcasGA2_TC000341 [Tribolium castaneum]|uniref:Uncharacterized protein n=1 Tax=Tribolium castaneum TaxID=7070 RepID=D6WAU0_TRICA|nr:hypothetical protein TcasGA2_TC000341 [Tribolium castaneum]
MALPDDDCHRHKSALIALITQQKRTPTKLWVITAQLTAALTIKCVRKTNDRGKSNFINVLEANNVKSTQEPKREIIREDVGYPSVSQT